MSSRRQFVKLTGTGIIAAGARTVYGSTSMHDPDKKSINLFTLGMAGYTFTEIPLEKAIGIMKKNNINNLSLKDVYLPLNSTLEVIKGVKDKFNASGINIYTVGVIYMKNIQEVDQAFEYARMTGVKMIVCAPDYDLLPYTEQKAIQYGFRIAIHNHGPDKPVYPNATDIWNHIKDMDQCMGICLDIGHTIRDGHDPCKDAWKYSKRLFDVHIKDVTLASKEGKAIEIGRGIIDIPDFVDTLRKIKYSGMCSIEYEKDMKDPVEGIAESVGYFRGVMACKG